MLVGQLLPLFNTSDMYQSRPAALRVVCLMTSPFTTLSVAVVLPAAEVKLGMQPTVLKGTNNTACGDPQSFSFKRPHAATTQPSGGSMNPALSSFCVIRRRHHLCATWYARALSRDNYGTGSIFRKRKPISQGLCRCSAGAGCLSSAP